MQTNLLPKECIILPVQMPNVWQYWQKNYVILFIKPIPRTPQHWLLPFQNYQQSWDSLTLWTLLDLIIRSIYTRNTMRPSLISLFLAVRMDTASQHGKPLPTMIISPVSSCGQVLIIWVKHTVGRSTVPEPDL